MPLVIRIPARFFFDCYLTRAELLRNKFDALIAEIPLFKVLSKGRGITAHVWSLCRVSGSVEKTNSYPCSANVSNHSLSAGTPTQTEFEVCFG